MIVKRNMRYIKIKKKRLKENWSKKNVSYGFRRHPLEDFVIKNDK